MPLVLTRTPGQGIRLKSGDDEVWITVEHVGPAVVRLSSTHRKSGYICVRVGDEEMMVSVESVDRNQVRLSFDGDVDVLRDELVPGESHGRDKSDREGS